jgi:hypothetical protein
MQSKDRIAKIEAAAPEELPYRVELWHDGVGDAVERVLARAANAFPRLGRDGPGGFRRLDSRGGKDAACGRRKAAVARNWRRSNRLPWRSKSSWAMTESTTKLLLATTKIVAPCEFP